MAFTQTILLVSFYRFADGETKAGFAAVDSFDVQVKARNILPPIGVVGLALHAAKAPSQTLSADTNRLAGQIVKKLNEHTKQPMPNVRYSYSVGCPTNDGYFCTPHILAIPVREYYCQ